METTKIIDINLKIMIPPRRAQAFEIFARSIGWKEEDGLDSATFIANHLVAKFQGLKYSSHEALKKYQGEAGREEMNALIAEYEQAVKITHRILNGGPTE